MTDSFDSVFREGLRELSLLNLSPLRRKVLWNDRFAALAIGGFSANYLKRLLMRLEERHPLGRLWDLDVYLGEECISGAAVGRPTRSCFLCDEPALVCRRLQRHTKEEVFTWVKNEVETFVRKREELKPRVTRIGQAAHEAIAAEARVTPKPGLVDERGGGVHRDMDLELLIESSNVIAPYLAQCADLAARRAIRGIVSPLALFRKLQPIGIKAEEVMFARTGGVNTHKGMIFSIGLLCGAAGSLVGRGEQLEPSLVCQEASAISSGLVAHFDGLNKENINTKGEANYLSFQSRGIRGEAEQGFPCVLKVALPEYISSIKRYDGHVPSVRTLLALMAVVEDSNVLYRSGPAGQKHLQECAKAALDNGWPTNEKGKIAFANLEDFCLQCSLSPGGSADLLAVTIFLHSISNL